MISRYFIFAIMGLFTLFFACQRNEVPHIKIAYASNMQFVINELADVFQKEHGIECLLIKGSSGKLFAQISQGAPFDIFLSANDLYTSKLLNDHLLLAAPKTFAEGQLILWSHKKIDSLSLINELKIGIPNPKHAPYGIAALEYLKNQKLFKTIEPKLIYGESVSQVNQFIDIQSVDLGFTSQSIIHSNLKNKGYWLFLDKKQYPSIKHSIAILKKNSNLEMSKKFLKFMFSEKAQAILKTYGYYRRERLNYD